MDEHLDLRGYLRPGEVGLATVDTEGCGYDESLDCDCTPEAAAMLAYLDRWSDGNEPELPPELLGKSLLSQVAQKLAIRLLIVKGKLRGERFWGKHNAAVRFKLGRRAADTEHEAETKAAAIALFDSLVAAGKKKTAAYKAVENKFNITGRTLRRWKKSP